MSRRVLFAVSVAVGLFFEPTASVRVLAGLAHAAETFARSSVEIITSAGGHFTFKVEVAETNAQQAQGLMFRKRLPDDAGMLFPYAKAQSTAFWMRNTLIPLDIIFIGADGRIARIHPMATPGSETTIPSGGPVKAVLEINGGFAARLGIRVGDQVRHATFAAE